MRALALRSAAVTLLVVSVACTNAAPEQFGAPVADRSARISYQGLVSLLPPQGASWYVRETREALSFSKHVDTDPFRSNARTALAEVRLLYPSDGRSHAEGFEEIRRGLSADSSGGRLNRFSMSFEEERRLGADCLRYAWSAEDRGVPDYSDAVFILSYDGVFCFHTTRDVIVHANYSQRHFQGQEPLSLGEEGEAFLTSLRFLDGPLPTRAPLLEPSVVKVILSNSLRDRNAPPREFDNADGRGRYASEGFELQEKKAHDQYGIYMPQSATARDVRVEVDVTFLTPRDPATQAIPGIDIACRYNEADRSAYYFRLRVDGTYEVFRYLGDSRSAHLTLGSGGTATAPLVAGENHLQADCLGADPDPVNLIFTVNQTRLLTLEDGQYAIDAEGRQEFDVFSGDQSGFTARFANLVVSELASK